MNVTFDVDESRSVDVQPAWVGDDRALFTLRTENDEVTFHVGLADAAHFLRKVQRLEEEARRVVQKVQARGLAIVPEP